MMSSRRRRRLSWWLGEAGSGNRHDGRGRWGKEYTDLPLTYHHRFGGSIGRSIPAGEKIGGGPDGVTQVLRRCGVTHLRAEGAGCAVPRLEIAGAQ